MPRRLPTADCLNVMVPVFTDANAYKLGATCTFFARVIETGPNGESFSGSRGWSACVLVSRNAYGEDVTAQIVDEVPPSVREAIMRSVRDERWMWITAIPGCRVAEVRASAITLVAA